MNRIKQALAGFAMTGLAMAGVAAMPAAPASATTVSVSGGTWWYDAGFWTAFSYFHHPSKLHRSSVKTCEGTYRSPDARAGNWSYAELGSCPWGNEAFYNVY